MGGFCGWSQSLLGNPEDVDGVPYADADFDCPLQELMKSMAKLSNGIYMEPKDIHKLCGYFMVQVCVTADRLDIALVWQTSPKNVFNQGHICDQIVQRLIKLQVMY